MPCNFFGLPRPNFKKDDIYMFEFSVDYVKLYKESEIYETLDLDEINDEDYEELLREMFYKDEEEEMEEMEAQFEEEEMEEELEEEEKSPKLWKDEELGEEEIGEEEEDMFDEEEHRKMRMAELYEDVDNLKLYESMTREDYEALYSLGLTFDGDQWQASKKLIWLLHSLNRLITTDIDDIKLQVARLEPYKGVDLTVDENDEYLLFQKSEEAGNYFTQDKLDWYRVELEDRRTEYEEKMKRMKVSMVLYDIDIFEIYEEHFLENKIKARLLADAEGEEQEEIEMEEDEYHDDIVEPLEDDDTSSSTVETPTESFALRRILEHPSPARPGGPDKRKTAEERIEERRALMIANDERRESYSLGDSSERPSRIVPASVSDSLRQTRQLPRGSRRLRSGGRSKKSSKKKGKKKKKKKARDKQLPELLAKVTELLQKAKYPIDEDRPTISDKKKLEDMYVYRAMTSCTPDKLINKVERLPLFIGVSEERFNEIWPKKQIGMTRLVVRQQFIDTIQEAHSAEETPISTTKEALLPLVNHLHQIVGRIKVRIKLICINKTAYPLKGPAAETTNPEENAELLECLFDTIPDFTSKTPSLSTEGPVEDYESIFEGMDFYDDYDDSPRPVRKGKGKKKK